MPNIPPPHAIRIEIKRIFPPFNRVTTPLFYFFPSISTCASEIDCPGGIENIATAFSEYLKPSVMIKTR